MRIFSAQAWWAAVGRLVPAAVAWSTMGLLWAAEPPLSSETEECVFCHEMVTPGLVADWRASRHSRVTPSAALGQAAAERRVSAEEVPAPMSDVVVGCYECHGQNADAHPDSFDHEGYRIHVIVTPKDCQTCHPVEVEQYSRSKHAHAWGNIRLNPLYHQMMRTVGNPEEPVEAAPHLAATPDTEVCYDCHGTKVEVQGMRTRELLDGSEIEVPKLLRWPNHGVGRVNPDGSLGACTACHPRHSFAIEIARKPRTCAQCHLAPDTPAWEVYRESKHGNIALSMGEEWNWGAVPWVPGRDFKAPTCATCHASALADTDGTVLVERTHDFGSRLWVRLFGLPYAHPQPKTGATDGIRNAEGQPLPTTFAGEPASEYLLTAEEQKIRRDEITKVCVLCHNTDYAQSFLERLEAEIERTNEMTRRATALLQRIWKAGGADPANPFDELAEMKWVENWLFYATSIRYARAMGGPDHAGFKNGWWALHRNLLELEKLARESEAQAPK